MANTLNTESIQLVGKGPARAGNRIVMFTYVDDNSRTIGTSTQVVLDGTETAEQIQTKAVAAANAIIGN